MHRLIGVVVILAAAALPLQAYRYAFVVGQNRGGPTVDDLRYAEMDARRFADLLQEYAGVDQGNLQLLLHPDSTTLTAAVGKFIDRIAAGSDPQHALLFFFYSGHADGEGLLLDSSHMAFSELHHLLSNAAAGIRLVIIDACQSGAIMAFKGGKRAEPFYLAAQQKTQGEVWIASSSANERAQESESLKGSLFSFHLFNGLRGSADISNDNKVTVAEAYQYAYRKTLETSMLTSGIVQHPVYRFNITGEGDIVLTDLSQRRGGLLVDGSCSGTFLIMSRDYISVFADFHKESQREMFIAFPSGDFTIINARGGTDIGLYQFSISGKKTQRCGSGQFRASLVREARMKGGEEQPPPPPPPSDTVVLGRENPIGLVINGGGGVDVYSSSGETYWQPETFFSLRTGLLFRRSWLFAFSCTGIPSNRIILTDIGIERRFATSAGYYFIGGGATFGWLYDQNSLYDRKFGAGFTVEGGMLFDLIKGIRAGIVIPWRYTGIGGRMQSAGMALRLEFSRTPGTTIKQDG
ncbi:MAG: caspase family protein [Chitinispirillaceae bacterium]|nr:caspase family protein [Chitinispirillaceae bacterium]